MPSSRSSPSSSSSSSSVVARASVAARRVASSAPARKSADRDVRVADVEGEEHGADDTRRVAVRAGPARCGTIAVRPASVPPPTEETPGVEPAARQVLRQPGRRDEPHGHAPPAPAAAQADGHLPLPARSRGRRPRDRLGGADRRRHRRHVDLLHAAGDHPQHRFVRAPRVRDAARPAARLHARPGRRARDRRVRADRPRASPTTSPFAPRQLAFDTSGYVQMELQGLDVRGRRRTRRPARPGRTAGRARPARRRACGPPRATR